jgi:hypothetical protein
MRLIIIDGAAAATDPFFSDVILLLHGSEANGATDLVDYSPVGRDVACFGSAAITTSLGLFGGGSISQPGASPVTDFVLVDNAVTDFRDFLAKNWTIEVAFAPKTNWDSGSAQKPIIASWISTTTQSKWMLDYYAGNLRFLVHDETGGVVYTLTYAVNLTAGTFYRAAGVRDGTNVYLYFEGAKQDTEAVGTFAFQAWNHGPKLGANVDETVCGDMNITEVRVTLNQARYTGATYTLASAPFPNA